MSGPELSSAPSSALSAISGAHSRRGALRAIAAHLNTAREAALSIAQAAFHAEHGRWVDFPPNGPVLPFCVIDDPVDDVLDQGPDGKPKIMRRLSLISGGVRQGAIISNAMDEPIHNHELEWVIIVPAQYDLDMAHDIFYRGLSEIDTTFAGLRHSGLTPHPQITADPIAPSSAISFDYPNVEYLTFDLGDHRAFSATIALELILDALSILS